MVSHASRQGKRSPSGSPRPGAVRAHVTPAHWRSSRPRAPAYIATASPWPPPRAPIRSTRLSAAHARPALRQAVRTQPPAAHPSDGARPLRGCPLLSRPCGPAWPPPPPLLPPSCLPLRPPRDAASGGPRAAAGCCVACAREPQRCQRTRRRGGREAPTTTTTTTTTAPLQYWTTTAAPGPAPAVPHDDSLAPPYGK
eukprot:scaffold2058_cov403-Prasinococcus_capsulatus_cf.AAC.16